MNNYVIGFVASLVEELRVNNAVYSIAHFDGY
jgi:hypothetical protein